MGMGILVSNIFQILSLKVKYINVLSGQNLLFVTYCHSYGSPPETSGLVSLYIIESL